jgi:hypothetical protein
MFKFVRKNFSRNKTVFYNTALSLPIQDFCMICGIYEEKLSAGHFRLLMIFRGIINRFAPKQTKGGDCLGPHNY